MTIIKNKTEVITPIGPLIHHIADDAKSALKMLNDKAVIANLGFYCFNLAEAIN